MNQFVSLERNFFNFFFYKILVVLLQLRIVKIWVSDFASLTNCRKQGGREKLL